MVSSREQEARDLSAGARLREARRKAGLSQEHVADEAHLGQSAVSKLERLGPGGVTWAAYCRIANSLGFVAEVRLVPIDDH